VLDQLADVLGAVILLQSAHGYGSLNSANPAGGPGHGAFFQQTGVPVEALLA